MFPIKYIDNNLVWNKDNEVFAYYELIPYNYSFLSAEQKFIVHDSFRQLIAQSREGKIHALQIATESSIRSMQEQSKKLVMVLCQEKVQIKYNQFSLCLAKLNLLFLSHYLLDFSDILPHIGLGINTRNGCEYVLYCKMFLCIQKSTYMHVYN